MTEQIALAVAAPLITKAEHIAGEKLLTLVTRWGETITLKLVALGWRELRRLSEHVTANNLSSAQHVELIVNSSLASQSLSPAEGERGEESGPIIPTNKILDHLDAPSVAQVISHALALSLGEKALAKNAEATPTGPATILTPSISNAGEPSATSSPPDGTAAPLPAGPLPS